MKKILFTFIIAISLFVSGCGGSSAGDDSSTAAESPDDKEGTGEEEDTVSAGTDSEETDSSSVDTADAADTFSSDNPVDLSYADDDGNLVIPLDEIGKTAVFAGYVHEDTVMEIFAVLDDDGVLHYALNTCQVCSGSPYAYYEQDGSSFICQNCGNVFDTSQIGVQRGGCNPVPMDHADVTEDSLVVTKEALSEYAEYFRNWKGLN